MTANPLNRLSKREREIVLLVARGISNKEVAVMAFITEKTVKFHLTNIYKKLQIKSRAQLKKYYKPHLVTADENLPEGDVHQ